MKFLSGLWRGITAVKSALGNIIFLLVVILIAIAVFTSDNVRIDDDTALVLSPSGVIVEQQSIIRPFDGLLQQSRKEVVLRDLLKVITHARNDSRIAAMVLDLSELQGATMGNLEEISTALTDFKVSGKPVYAFGDEFTQPQYFLASQADRIILNKDSFQALGGVFLTGFGIYPTYYKSALDKLKVDINVFTSGDYKDAVEPYLLEGMSEKAKEANSAWLRELWLNYGDTITEHRGISVEALEDYINSYGTLLAAAGNDSAQLALNHGFVDELLSESEWREEMQTAVGRSGRTYRQVSYDDYLREIRPSFVVPKPGMSKIAVITASGTILDGEQPSGNIGGETTSRLLRQARWDDDVKALVLRINSPGGSAAASEKIRHEIESTLLSDKPVVVSMSSYAASGGYWISSSASKIFALESTVTGSIGTFMLFPTFERSLAELGIYSDGVGTTELSGTFNLFKSIGPVFQDTLEKSVDHTYSKFLSLVAKGRDLSLEEAEEVAKGRIWTGKTAVELGLVDAIGGLDEAIEAAAQLAGTDDYEVIHLEQTLSPGEQLVISLLNSGLQTLLQRWFPINNQIQAVTAALPLDLLKMSESPGVYVQCLYCNVQ